MQIATTQEMREMDRVAIKERQIPSTDLMERAAAGIARCALGLIGAERGGRAICFCGPGNNGGDGIAAARLLAKAGVEVRAVLVGRREKMTADAQEMERRLGDANILLEDFEPESTVFSLWCQGADVMIDALFGIGLNTVVAGAPLRAIQIMNKSAVPVVSADIPSGIEADTGRVLGLAVEAACTVTFTLPKLGHFVGRGGVCTGALTVVDIGIPGDLLGQTEDKLHSVFPHRLMLPRRPRDGHKGTFGKVYILGGCTDYPGAPYLAARGAERCGAGLVRVGVPAPLWPVVASKLNCAMPHPLPAGKDGTLSLEAVNPILEGISHCGVCLIGPGLGSTNGVHTVIRRLLGSVHIPVVLDADGINALVGHIDVLDGRRGQLTVLTPHDGEFARLSGSPPGEDRVGAARRFAEEHGCCLVLKGYRTITAFPDGTVYMNTTGNPGMAKGGSGDVLGGMILALLGQGFSAREAVPMAVCLHGRAGDICAAQLGEYAMTPVDLIEALPRALQESTE